MELNLRAVLFIVSNLERATAFYEEGLGLTPSRKAGAMTTFELGGTTLALVNVELAGGIVLTEGAEAGGGTVLTHAARSREEVDELLAQVEKAGGRIIRAAAENDFGGYNGSFADLDDHIWNVGYNVDFFRA